MGNWLSSKKAKAFLTGLIVLIAVHLIGLDETTATKIADGVLKLTVGYMGSQAIADVGKEKAKIETEATVVNNGPSA